MARYIDADKVLAEFPIRRNHYDEKNGNIHFINGIETVMEYIDTVADEQPADVQEVKHGHWFFTEYDFFDCSICGNAYPNDCNSTSEAKERLKKKYDLFKYCPYCGARMDEEE